ncbi:MAG: hypothetical protein OHK0023_06100 [Anaerolineae bacterium]
MPTVLLAEDDKDLLMLYRAAMTHQGLTVIEVSDGASLLEKLQQSDFTFDLAIFDIEMPELPSLRAIEYIRSEPRLAEKPIIVVTANDRYQERLKGKVDYFFVKPIAIGEVMRLALTLTTG